MRYNIQISEKAEDDLDAIIEYISTKLKAPNSAADFLDIFELEIDNLRTSPKAFKLIDDDTLIMEKIRVLQIKNYLAFFIIDEKEKMVSIIRVLYGRRDWLNILKIEET
jgi:plasmid stabilization system protein ParE